MVHPTIANLVRHRQEMERYKWCTLLSVFITSALIILISLTASKKEITQLIPDAGGGLTERAQEKLPAVKATQGFVQTSGGVMCLIPFGKFNIVNDDADISNNLSPFHSNTNIYSPEDVNGLPDGSLTFSTETGNGDCDYGLPSRKVTFRPINQVSQWKIPERSEPDRLPAGIFPRIPLTESSTSPSLKFIPDSAYVKGWLVFQTDGQMKFDPLTDKHPEVSDRLQRFLTNAVKNAYARTRCTPAIIDGKLTEKRFLLRVTFNGGDDHYAYSGSTEVLMQTL